MFLRHKDNPGAQQRHGNTGVRNTVVWKRVVCVVAGVSGTGLVYTEYMDIKLVA